MDADNKSVAGISDYLKDSKEALGVYAWVWRDMINEESKKCAKKMLVLIVVSHIFSLSMPFIIGMAVDSLVVRDIQTAMYQIGLITFLLLLSYGPCSYYIMKWREFILGENGMSLDERSNKMFFDKSLGQHLRESDSLSASNVEKGRARILEIENMLLYEGIESLLNLLVAFVFLVCLSVVAGLILIASFVIFILWSVFLSHRIARECIPIERDFRALNRHRVERWEQIERVKTCAKENDEHVYMNAWFHRIIKEDRKFWFWFIKQINIRGVVHVVSLCSILAYGAYKVYLGDYAIGLYVPLFMWTKMVMDNMARVGHIEQRLNWSMPAVRSMMKALMIPSDIKDSEKAVALEKGESISAEFVNVHYEYPSEKISKAMMPVLRNVSFEVKDGEIVALLGKSGAGKTTIMRLLQRGMDPTRGKILVNGIDLREIKLSSLIGNMGYIPQQSAILNGTLRYNLTYGLSGNNGCELSDFELRDAMQKLEIDFGERLTDGLDTKVGRRGIKLSGGEAQRVMIGAAVVKRPQLMIIDEATSSLDSTTERAVQKGLAEVLKNGMSALIIAHRLSTVRDICDKFVVLRHLGELKNGDPQVEAVASSFEELFEISPTFRMLARDQGIVV